MTSSLVFLLVLSLAAIGFARTRISSRTRTRIPVSAPTPPKPVNAPQKITLEMMREAGLLNSMNSYDVIHKVKKELANRNETLTYQGEAIVTESRERSAAGGMPDQAFCQPRPVVVELEPYNPTSVTWPSCITVQRCGGCCNHPVMKCAAQIKKTTSVLYVKYNLKGNGLQASPQVMSKNIEFHEKCDCACRLSASDCNLAIHNFQGCECVCKDPSAQFYCEMSNKKSWDESTCQCKCIDSCGPSFIQDPATCQCTADRTNVQFHYRARQEAAATTSAPPTVSNPCSKAVCPVGLIPYLKVNNECGCKINQNSVYRVRINN